MLAPTDLPHLLNHRFWDNLLPIPATNSFTIGSLAPPFQLVNAGTGETVKLLDYTGDRKPVRRGLNRPVLLAFTRIFTEKVYCPLCYPHLLEMNAAYEQFVAQGAAVFLIASIDLQQSQTVLKDLGLKMPLLSDPRCRVFRAYRVGQALGAPLPAQFVLDRTGRIRYLHLFSFFEPNASVARLITTLEQV